MKLDVLQEKIPLFANALRTRDGDVHRYKYAMLDHFRTHWSFDTEDFAGMYSACLENTVTRRWWKRETYRPKEVMLEFIRTQEPYVRQSFRELFNEHKQVENRIDSFRFYCDELLSMYKKSHPRSIENNHYHDGAMISLYLAAMYPEKYPLYPGHEIFNEALRALHAKPSETEDLPRYFKVSNTLYSFLQKDPSIQEMITSGHRPTGNKMLVHEFIYFLAGRWSEHVL
jgi:hypothetical protein